MPRAYSAERRRETFDILLAGWIALEGTADLAEREQSAIDARFPAYLSERGRGFRKLLDGGWNDRLDAALKELSGGSSCRAAAAGKDAAPVCAAYDTAGESIYEALWDLAAEHKCGLEIDLRGIPVRQETVEIAELCGEDPYEMVCGGCRIVLAREGLGEAVAEKLRTAGIPVEQIGRTMEGNAKSLRFGENIRFLDKPRRKKEIARHRGI